MITEQNISILSLRDLKPNAIQSVQFSCYCTDTVLLYRIQEEIEREFHRFFFVLQYSKKEREGEES